MNELLKQSFWGNTTAAWATAVLILAVSYVAILIFKRVIISKLRKWSQKTTTNLDDFLIATVERSVVPLLYLSAVYFTLSTLSFSLQVDRVIYVAFLFAFTFFLLGIITSFVRHFVFSFIKKQENGETKEKQARGLLMILNVVIWILGIIFLIDNLGYNITTLITGLGIGGIAIALAAQTILGDLFSYFTIFFDRPFEIGDFIIVDDKMGTVEYIGIKTTRLRSLSGEQIICSNTNLTNSRVHNYKRMEQRRIVFKLSLTHQTQQEKLKRVPEMVKSIIESKEKVRFDRGHFMGFGSFSLDFEFVYFVLSSDYNFYMDRQQEIYLDIVAAFHEEKIKFAYPTQTLFVNTVGLSDKNLPIDPALLLRNDQ